MSDADSRPTTRTGMPPRSWLGAGAAPALGILVMCLGVGCGRDNAVANARSGGAAGTVTGTGGVAGHGTGSSGGSPGSGGAAGAAEAGTGGASAAGQGGDTPAPASGGAAGGGGRSGAGGEGPSAELPGGVAWEPWPTVEAVPAGTCAVKQFNGGDPSSAAKLVRDETWQYDTTTHILTRSRPAMGGFAASTTYVRLDSQGRREMLCRADEYFLCLEWTRDSFGNAKGYSLYGVDDGPRDARTLDPAHPPTKAVPRNAGGESETHRLTYDGAGLLSTGTYYYPQRGATLAFTRDSEGRCSDVAWSIGGASLMEVDHSTYAGGKLVSRTVTNMNDPADVRAVITYWYDSEGALAATVVDGRLDFPDAANAPAPRRDGSADYIVRTVKQSDGSRWVEALDFELGGSVSTVRVLRNGISTATVRVRWYFSPACEALALPRHTSNDCEFERPLASMPLGWHNPLVTPIPGWAMTPMPD